MHGLILSGGKNSALGPLGLGRSRSLLHVGQKPLLIRQYQQLRGIGCSDITIIVSPDTARAVREVVEHTGIKVQIVVQAYPRGAVDALSVGVQKVWVGPVVVILGDTYVEDAQMPPGSNTVGVGPAPEDRVATRRVAGVWRDGPVNQGEPGVTMGVFRFDDLKELERATYLSVGTGFAALLNAYRKGGIRPYSATDAYDAANLPSLRRMSRRFITRSHQHLDLPERGVLTKYGMPVGEAESIVKCPLKAAALFPRVFSYSTSSYEMEYIPQPTLAELFLYYPAGEGMWTHITQTLLGRVASDLWPVPSGTKSYSHYRDGLVRRYLSGRGGPVPEPHNHDRVTLNGEEIVTGPQMLNRADELVKRHVVPCVRPGLIHGDLSFTNVLWNLQTSTFHLIDPDMGWSSPAHPYPTYGDTHGDVAKVCCAPALAAVTHGLFKLEREGSAYHLEDLPTNSEIEQVCLTYTPALQLATLTAWMMLYEAPLFRGDAASALYLEGARAIQDLWGHGR